MHCEHFYLDEAEELTPCTCPECGFDGTLEDDFDIIGACSNNVFCTQCHQEFDPATGELHTFDPVANACCREVATWLAIDNLDSLKGGGDATDLN